MLKQYAAALKRELYSIPGVVDVEAGMEDDLPEYRLTRTVGPDHQKLFVVELAIRGEPVAEAMGTSKKEAEQEAARLALEKLRIEN